jgi:hypothetical protein
MPLFPNVISRHDLLDQVANRIELLQHERPDAPNTARWMADSTRMASAMFERIGIEAGAHLARAHEFATNVSNSGLVYPDLELEAPTGELFALDIKTCQLRSETLTSGFTLGTYRGYFRGGPRNLRPGRLYRDYSEHWILGIIYDAACPFDRHEIVLWPKYRLAGRRTGSRNTSNIGSVTDLGLLRDGLGPFAPLGEKAFEAFWRAFEPGPVGDRGVALAA